MMPEFDHYTVSRVLGEGGMGLVYLAQDRRTTLPVAIKVISMREFDPDLQARFLKENRILAAMNHRNIVRCYEITESTEGVLSIVMEYVDGVDFRAFEGRPFPELLPLMIQALMGLSYLRSQNVLHRDLSSNNIFVTLENQTRVTKILDFGVAKMLEEEAVEGDVKTRTGQFLGKFAYASPEHFSPATIDWRSDVYSLGVIFHRLLTAKLPLTVARQGNFFDWLMVHQRENTFDVAAPPEVPPLPEALRGVVRRMLSRNADDRPRSYEEIVDVLDRVQRNVPLSLQPDLLSLRTLPPPVEGKIGSSGSARTEPASPSPVPSRPPAASFRSVEPEDPAPLEVSQQKRWPDLETPESHTERFVAFSPAPPSQAPPPRAPAPTPAPTRAPAPAPAPVFSPVPVATPPPIPARPSPPADPPPPEPSAGGNPGTTDMLPPPPFPDATTTASIEFSGKSDIFPEVSSWAPKPAEPGPSSPPADVPAHSDVPPFDVRPASEFREDKTERLDDVIEKLRQQSLKVPLPPLEPPAATVPPSRRSAEQPPMAPASQRTAPMAPSVAQQEEQTHVTSPSGERAASAPPKPARRLVVYGEPEGSFAAPPAVPERAVAPPPAPVLAPGGRRSSVLRVGLIVAAIVVLFAMVLWVLVLLVRRATPGDAPRSSRVGSSGAIARTA